MGNLRSFRRKVQHGQGSTKPGRKRGPRRQAAQVDPAEFTRRLRANERRIKRLLGAAPASPEQTPEQAADEALARLKAAAGGTP